MLDFSDIKVVIKKEDDNSGVYEIAPILKGFGNTLVNPLRRVLLSSMEGCGITSIKVKGADHEYSTLEGVKEDLVEIILNLKKIKFKIISGESHVCKIKFTGKGVVKASDIQVDQNVEVLNKEVEIANISSEKGTFEMEMTVEKGTGYRDVDESLRNEIGRIPLSCDFSPIKLVNMEVGKARKGQDLHWDSVIITIETDGSIKPREALIESATTLQSFAGKIMVSLGIAKEDVEKMAEESLKIDEVEESTNENEILSWNIEDLEVSKRTKTALLNAGYTNIKALSVLNMSELRGIRGLGSKSLSEIVALLESYSIKLAEKE